MTNPRWRTLDGRAPRVIAHRGASGERPEHTMAAYALAIAQGADVIEPDLVPTRDGVLVARHDRTLARSTDVARHATFAARRIAAIDDWHADAFDAAEIAMLRARQPFDGRSATFDGRFAVPRFGEILDALDDARRDGHPALLAYPELKHPRELAASGIDVARLFVAELRARYRSGASPVWLQCFDRATLLRVRAQFDLPAHWLLDAADALALDDAALASIRAEGLAGLGVAKAALIDANGRETGFVARAHAHGLAVHGWTYRDDRVAAPFASIEAELAAAFAAGIDALFCDFPATALRVREELESR